MTSFANSSLRLLRRLLHPERHADAPHGGAVTVLDGCSAVAAIEARAADVVALGGTFPAAVASRAWARHASAHPLNAFGARVSSIDADGPRSALAAALGAGLAGQRSTVFLSGPDLAASADLLRHAAGQHVPIVLHLSHRAATTIGAALGSGHEAYHDTADSGAIHLHAVNVQEAADLALIARRVAEHALLPSVVAADGEQTALAAQDVRLADDELVRLFLGRPDEPVETPTPSQQAAFGSQRRRVPRLHDLDQPLLLSPARGPESWGLGQAGARPYFAEHVPSLLDKAFEHFAEETGRRYDTTLAHRVDDAMIVLVAQGAAVETAIAVADRAREHAGARVGVLGIRVLRPFPAAAVARALAKAQTVAVLERVDAPLATDGPLAREVRAALEMALDATVHRQEGTDLPALHEKSLPTIVNVPFGLGGLPLRAADLHALVRELAAPKRRRVYLGLDFVRGHSPYPKQQASLDALRRSHPGLESLALRSHDDPPEARPAGALTVAIHRSAGGAHESLACDLAALLHEAAGGGALRTRPGLSWRRVDDACIDVVTFSREPLLDPGDDVAADVLLVLGRAGAPHRLPRLARDASILVVDEAPVDIVPAGLATLLAESDRELLAVRVEADPPWHGTEAALGGVLAIAARRLGDLASSRQRSARSALLGHLDEAQRDARLEAFERAGSSLERISDITSTDAPTGAPAPPAAVRDMGRGDDSFRSIARFWNEAGVLYGCAATDELVADPVQAMGSVPPLTSMFRDVGAERRRLPVFVPTACDGDPVLWTTCPDGSVAPLVIAPRALVDAGLELVTASGGSADALRAIAAPLARNVNRVLVASDAPPDTAGGLLEAAFAMVAEKKGIEGERRTELEGALAALNAEIGELPVARTPFFFDEPEEQAPGSGELFCLVVNPDTCKCPGLLATAGEGHGLMVVEQTPERVAAARRAWAIWERLPDTAGATIERARTSSRIGPLAAIMLSRHGLHAMAGGDGAEAASGAKLALRQVMGLAEFHLQPRLQQRLAELDALQDRLGTSIRDLLADALPTGDLDALAEGLDLLGRADVSITSLSARVDDAVLGGHVNGAHLGRLVDAARALADLRWRLAEGADGLARARAGVTIAPGAVASWAGVYPFNPWRCPATVAGGDEAGPLARGLLEGHLRSTLDGIRWTRRAEMELERPGEAAHAERDLAALSFDALDATERALCPPMVLVGDDASLGGRGLAQLAWLLASDLPVKIIILGDIGGRADGGLAVDAMGEFPGGRRFDLALLAMLTRTAYVAQTSIGAPDHFATSVLGAFASPGPALVHIHAPSPERHGFAPERLVEQARLAVRSRAFPLLRFDPAGTGVFGSCLDLDGNPDPDARWITADTAITPVDWAVTERRFEESLVALAPDAPLPTPIAEYLDLAPAERAGRTPYVLDAEGARRAVRTALCADAAHRVRFWRTLQELAGVVTPFTEAVRAEAEQAVAGAHRKELDELRRAHEARIAQLRAEFEAEATQRVASGLMTLAGYGADGHDAPGGAP